MGYSSGRNKSASWGNAQEDINADVGSGVIGGSNGGEGAPGLVSTRSSALKPSTGVSYSVPDSAKPGTSFSAEAAPTYSSPSTQGVGNFSGYQTGFDATGAFGQTILNTGMNAALSPQFINALGSFSSNLFANGSLDWSAFDGAFSGDSGSFLSGVIGSDAAGWVSSALPYLTAIQSLFSGNAERGAGEAIGAYVGTMIPIPVFGTLIGATLGDILGGMWEDKDYPYGRLQFSSDPTTDKFNVTESYVLDGFPQGQLDQMGTSLADNLNKLISELHGDITGDINTVFGYGDPSHYASKGWFAGDKNTMLNPEFQNLDPSQASVAWLRYNLQKGLATDTLDFGNQQFEDILAHSNAYTQDQFIKDLTAAAQVGNYYSQRNALQDALNNRSDLDAAALSAFEQEYGPVSSPEQKAAFADTRNQYWDSITSLLDQAMPEDVKSVYDSYMSAPDGYYIDKTLRDQYMADPTGFANDALANDPMYAKLNGLIDEATAAKLNPVPKTGMRGGGMTIADRYSPTSMLGSNFILGGGNARTGVKPNIAQRYAQAPTRYENGQLQRQVARDPSRPVKVGNGSRGGVLNPNPLVWMDV